MIKQPLFLYLSGGLLLLALGLGLERLVFIETAIETLGTVSAVTASNDRCGSRRSTHDCTEFTATISYFHRSEAHSTTTGAGSERGHGVPATLADLRVGERVPVLYSPRNPDRAYHDTFIDLWVWPLIALAGQIATMFGAFVPPKKQSRLW